MKGVTSLDELLSEKDRKVVACLMEVIPNALSRVRYDDDDLSVTMHFGEEERLVWRAFRTVYGDDCPDFEEWL